MQSSLQEDDAIIAFHPTVAVAFPEQHYYGAMFLATALHSCALDDGATALDCVDAGLLRQAIISEPYRPDFSLLKFIQPSAIRPCNDDDQSRFPHHSVYPETSIFWVCFDLLPPYQGERLLLHLGPLDHPPGYQLVGLVRF